MTPSRRPSVRPRPRPRPRSPVRVGEPEIIGSLIARMMDHVHRRSAGETLAILNQVGLTMAQLVALHALVHAGPRSVTELARCLRLSAAATSHLVGRLVDDALVERAENPADRRQKCVSITALGRRLVAQVQTERTRELASVVARLSPDIRGQFRKIMLRVVEALSSLPQDGS